MSVNAVASEPWYRSLDRSQWNTLLASNLGWLFDGYEVYALILTLGAALHQLLDPSLYPQTRSYFGFIIATTLLGWGVGGLIGGVLADYIGRKRTMMLAILAYSVMTARPRWRSTGRRSWRCASWSGLQSARSGRPAPRSWPSCGRTARVARARV